MENVITLKKINKYFDITEEALELVKKNIISGKEKQAKEIIAMSSNYISDAKHFFKEGMWVECFGALNYAHGWLDSGVRLDVFNVDNDRLFTVK